MRYLFMLLALIVFAKPCLAGDVKVVFATGEWPPYTSQSLPDHGAAAALVSAICRAAGIAPVYQFYPWKRAELKVSQGEVFAAFPYAISKERQTSYDFSEVLFHGVNVFVSYQKHVKADSPTTYQSLDDLHGYRVGCISGSFLYSLLEEAGFEYEPTTTIDQSLQKLVAGRLDLIIDNKDVLLHAIKRLYPNDVAYFKILPAPLEKTPTALLVSRTYPGSEEILSKFNKGLSIIKENGEYERIINTYRITR